MPVEQPIQHGSRFEVATGALASLRVVVQRLVGGNRLLVRPDGMQDGVFAVIERRSLVPSAKTGEWAANRSPIS